MEARERWRWWVPVTGVRRFCHMCVGNKTGPSPNQQERLSTEPRL